MACTVLMQMTTDHEIKHGMKILTYLKNKCDHRQRKLNMLICSMQLITQISVQVTYWIDCTQE